MADNERNIRVDRFWNRDNENDSESQAFGSDCDRILYSSAFRRLNGVTQVVSVDEKELFHNRLTHSYKVSQVAARIGHALLDQRNGTTERREATRVGKQIDLHGGLDLRVVRAAGYAHDLGHPPFGHVAEQELDRMLRPQGPRDPEVRQIYNLPDGFEGNAQSFRIVTKLAFREKDAVALDLTRATLSAILKYPWRLDEDLGTIRDDVLIDKRQKKWGAYRSESAFLEFARDLYQDDKLRAGKNRRLTTVHGRKAVEFRSIEAQVMDWADDITYAVHDVEDFFRANLVPLDELRRDVGNSNRLFDAYFDSVWPSIAKQVDTMKIKKEDAETWLLHDVFKTFPEERYAGRRSDREGLHSFAARLIREATASDRIKVAQGGLVLPDARDFIRIEGLKKLTRYYVIERPGVSSAQRGQRLLIQRLYKGLLRWAESCNIVGQIEAAVTGMKPDEQQNGDYAATRREAFTRWRTSRTAMSGTGAFKISSFTKDELNRVFDFLRELPSRLVDYLIVAFDPHKYVGCIDYTPEQCLSRAVVDYIVSLTEPQAVALDTRLSGYPAESMLEKWVSV